jgi:putative transposase
MTKKNKNELNAEELRAIEEAIAHDKKREVVKRASGIRMLHLGYTPEEVGKLLLVEAATVYNWRKRWRTGGLEGLADRPRSGRPRHATEDYRALLETTLAQPPAEAGYEFAIWTVERLREHLLAQTGIELSGERLRVLLAEMGYVYRRPKHDLTTLQNAAARADAEALLADLKNAPSEAILSFSLWTKQP